jgi:transposase
VIVEGKKGKIIDIREGKGSEHDFSLYKRTVGNEIHNELPVYADLGYLGINAFHAMSTIPRKASKYHPLSIRDKAFNKRLAKKRVIVEHINAKIKTFKSMSYPYRNHCKRHLLRMSLVCGIINLELRI